MKDFLLILVLSLAFCFLSCDNQREFILDANSMSQYYDHEYWANEIRILRSNLNLKEGELLKTDITLSITLKADDDDDVDVIITKGYNTYLMNL